MLQGFLPGVEHPCAHIMEWARVVFPIESAWKPGRFIRPVYPGTSPTLALDAFLEKMRREEDSRYALFEKSNASFRGATPSRVPTAIVFTESGLFDQPAFYLYRHNLIRIEHT